MAVAGSQDEQAFVTAVGRRLLGRFGEKNLIESHGDAVRNLNWKCVPSRLHRTLHGERIHTTNNSGSYFLVTRLSEDQRIFFHSEKNPHPTNERVVVLAEPIRGDPNREAIRGTYHNLDENSYHDPQSCFSICPKSVWPPCVRNTSRRIAQAESLAVLGLALVLPAASGTNFRSAASTRGPLARAHFAPRT